MNWNDPSDRHILVEALKADQIALASTDTVIGLLAQLTPAAFERLNAVKGRSNKPSLVLIQSVHKLPTFVDKIHLENSIERLMSHFWPGPLTIVFKAKSNLSPHMVAGDGTIALRIPLHSGLLETLGSFDGLFSTSANLTGEPVPTNIAQINPAITQVAACAIFDAQQEYPGVPSTIIGVSSGGIRLLREGVVSRGQLEAVLGHTLTS
jgi:L-threonylcarbamoyladenylate synthase